LSAEIVRKTGFSVLDGKYNGRYFLLTRLGAAILSNKGRELNAIAAYLYYRYPNNRNFRNLIFSEVTKIRDTDGIWPLAPTQLNSGEMVECNKPLSKYCEYDPYTYEVGLMCILRTQLMDDISCKKPLHSYVEFHDDISRNIAYGLMSEVCFALTQSEMEWALDAGDKTNFYHKKSKVRFDVTSNAKYKSADDYTTSGYQHCIAELVPLENWTLSNLIDYFKFKRSVYSKITEAYKYEFQWDIRPTSDISGHSRSRRTIDIIHSFLISTIPLDTVDRVKQKLFELHQTEDIDLREFEFAVLKFRKGVTYEYTSDSTYDFYDDEFGGYLEYDDGVYTVLVCNKFDELIQTNAGKEFATGQVTTYIDGDYSSGDTIKMCSNVPTWVEENTFLDDYMTMI